MRAALLAGSFSLVVVASMLVGGAITANVMDDDGDTPAAGEASPAATSTRAPIAAGGPAASTVETSAGAQLAPIADLPTLVAQVLPSVVELRLYGDGAALPASGVGSGVILDEDGHVLTNYHVVSGATEIEVTLAGGAVTSAEVVGADPGSDLAVVRLDLDGPALDGVDLQPARFGDSDGVQVGEPVFAIGNPFTQRFSVTAGIVSGVDRTSESAFTNRAIRGVIQTDAALNPGNSGGPLFNAAGEVIGINTSIEVPPGVATTQPFFVGLGFAVPSNTALRFLPEMLAGEEVRHPQLGVSGFALTPHSARALGFDESTRGVYVSSIVPGSAADEAGLRGDGSGIATQVGGGGDVIIAIEGERVSSFDELASAIDEHDVGETVTLTVLRDGVELELEATLLQWQ